MTRLGSFGFQRWHYVSAKTKCV